MSPNLDLISDSLENLKRYADACGSITIFSDLEKKIKRSITHILQKLNRVQFSEAEKVKISIIMQDLSRRITEFAQDKEGGNKLAAEVQAVAQSLKPPPAEMPELLDEIWEKIFDGSDSVDIVSGRF